MSILTELGFDHPVVKMWLRFEAARRGCKLQCGPYAWDLTKDTRVIRIARRQFASVGHLSTQFDKLFDALIASKAGHQSLLDFSRVHMHTYRVSGVTFELAQWPEPDATIDAYFEWYEPQAGDLVFDLGAECGVSTYVLSRLTGITIAFEPDPHLRIILERNVERHGLENVTVPKDAIASLAELIGLYGQPVFCKINLDQVTPEFLRSGGQVWTSLPLLFAAHSRSAAVRNRFGAFLKESGFETTSNEELGMLWGRRGEVSSPEQSTALSSGR